VESFFSGLKRTMGSTLTSRNPQAKFQPITARTYESKRDVRITFHFIADGHQRFAQIVQVHLKEARMNQRLLASRRRARHCERGKLRFLLVVSRGVFPAQHPKAGDTGRIPACADVLQQVGETNVLIRRFGASVGKHSYRHIK
jgi:hypothetical protein